jgi:histidinol-phosphatase
VAAPHRDLALAVALADLADRETMRRWSPDGVASTSKADGSPVTAADVAAEEAVLEAVRAAHPDDGFLGEEVGERVGTTGRRWIVDGIDGTRFFAAGRSTWGTLIALEDRGVVVLGVASSPAQDRRWWARRGDGAFTGSCSTTVGARRLRVAARRDLRPDLVVCLPSHARLSPQRQQIVSDLAPGAPHDRPWSHQLRVADGEVDLCVWFAGDVWDHAAPSVIVEEAGGRFTDHSGGRRLDTRTAVYSNGARHDEVVEALRHADD